MTTTETLKLALEALEVATTPLAKDRQEVLRAQAALREALAEQPAQQEPVAWLKVVETPGGFGKFVEAKPHEKGAKAVYTSPPEQRTWVNATTWVGLTDEEIWAMDAYTMAITDQETRWLYRLARAIEAKLKEKNCG